MADRFYEFACARISCKKPFEFHPTQGQLQALRCGAIVACTCSHCGDRYQWQDGGLKKLMASEEKRAALASVEIKKTEAPVAPEPELIACTCCGDVADPEDIRTCSKCGEQVCRSCYGDGICRDCFKILARSGSGRIA